MDADGGAGDESKPRSRFDVEAAWLADPERLAAFRALKERFAPYVDLDAAPVGGETPEQEAARAAARRAACRATGEGEGDAGPSSSAPGHALATLVLDSRDARFLNDVTYYRYAMARDFDVDKAEEMLWKTLHWRRTYRPDALGQAEIGNEAKDGKMYVSSRRDRAGRPIVYMKPRYDTTSPRDDRVAKVQYLVYVMEEAVRLMDEAHTGVHQTNIIIDFKGQGMSGKDSLMVSLDCLHILMDHYPERLGSAWMMNTSFVFSVFWRVISPFLPATTSAKIHFIGKSYEKLLEVADAEDIEEEFGGSHAFTFDAEEWRRAHP